MTNIQTICKQCDAPFTYSTNTHHASPAFCGACDAEGLQYNL